MNPREHPLFKQYPLNGRVVLTTGDVPTPYHIYNGRGVFIGGTASLPAVRDLCPNAIPISDNRTWLGIWVFDYTDASLGPHHELQFSFFTLDDQQAAPAQVKKPLTQPFSLLVTLLTNPAARMVCHGLWNNTPEVVAYNREWLHLYPYLAESQIEVSRECLRFSFFDRLNGALLLSGRINNPKRPSIRSQAALASQIGLGKLWQVAQQPWQGMQVIDPQQQYTAQTFIKADSITLHLWNPRDDLLHFGEIPYANLAFTPLFIQFMDDVKFVYCNPTSGFTPSPR